MRGTLVIRLEVWSDYASFNRPELKVERYSYDFITPSAARNILQAIYWHPSFNWVIDKIYICNPIERMKITRNEMKDKYSSSDMTKFATGRKNASYLKIDQTQRSASVLKNVKYVIEARFVPTGEEPFDQDKIYSIFCNRAKNGRCFNQPFMGTREFSANFKLLDNDEKILTADINKDCGLMLYDLEYRKKSIIPYFFHANIEHGVVDLTKCEVIR